MTSGHRRPAAPWLLGAALAGCALSLTACNPSDSGSNAPVASNAPGPGASGSSGVKIGCTIPTFSHPFFVSMRDGLQDEAKKNGAEINVVDGKDDASVQLSAIDNFVVDKVNAIILCPTETETLGPGVKKANGASIPVITVNRTVS